jgi:hypothetical protein
VSNGDPHPRAPRKAPIPAALPLAALALAGALGAWPLAGSADPVAALFWIAVLAPAAGALAAAAGLALVPLGWLVPLLWCAPVWFATGARPFPTLGWSALAWSGLFAAGSAWGTLNRKRGGSAWTAAGAALALTGALALLPARAALGARPWPASVAPTLLDLSPSALVVECAGVDWMRHAAVYDPVGTDRFERRAWRGALAGPAALVLGCALAAAAHLAGRRAAKPR